MTATPRRTIVPCSCHIVYDTREIAPDSLLEATWYPIMLAVFLVKLVYTTCCYCASAATTLLDDLQAKPLRINRGTSNCSLKTNVKKCTPFHNAHICLGSGRIHGCPSANGGRRSQFALDGVEGGKEVLLACTLVGNMDGDAN